MTPAGNDERAVDNAESGETEDGGDYAGTDA